MAFELQSLPYPVNALEPHMSARTLEFHHGKHHATYVKTLNELIQGTKYEKMSLEEIIKATAKAKTPPDKKIFNNAGQVWNHNFFWRCMMPNGGGEPAGVLADQIRRDFGGFDHFAEEFSQAATNQFGSGWAWLILDGGKLKVVPTANADDPVAGEKPALLTIDVWEHAYYLDYQNRRPDFIKTFLEHLVCWHFVTQNFERQRENAA